MSYGFGNCLLRKRLREVGMRQYELAQKSGKTEQQISDYIHGRKRMAYTTAVLFSEIIGCHAEDLYEWIRKIPDK